MSRRLAAGDERGAASAQARGIQLALLLTIPCAAASIAIPDLIMRALFARGAFTVADAQAAGMTLSAYAVGLLPFVMLRSFTAPFYARGDTVTPVKAALLAATVNIALKFVLMGPLAQVGLALATSAGAWINLGLLAFFARRQGFAVSGTAIGGPVAKLLLAGACLGSPSSPWPARASMGAGGGRPFPRGDRARSAAVPGRDGLRPVGAAPAWTALAHPSRQGCECGCGRSGVSEAGAPDPLVDSAALPDQTPPQTI